MINFIKYNLSLLKYFGSGKINIYTYRPWPSVDGLPFDGLEACRRQWQMCVSCRCDFKPIREITKNWLIHHGFEHHKLIVEDNSKAVRQRFLDADTGNVRVFIEDDLNNALRLALSCVKVILLSTPYNQCDNKVLPPNVVRVESWEDVIGHVLRADCQFITPKRDVTSEEAGGSGRF